MTSPRDESTVAHLLRQYPPAAATGVCPDDNLLAGWAEGRLDSERRLRVESHVAVCDACRTIVTDLADGLMAGSRHPSATRGADAPLTVLRGGRAGPWALAAAVLLAIGAGVTALLVGRGDRAEGGVDGRLVAAAEELRAAAPDVFAGFEPASPAERRTTRADATRAGLAVLRPAATVLEGRPRIEWEDALGAGAFDVVLAGPDGTVLWRRRASARTLDYPDDVPALTAGTSYVVEVEAVGGGGGRVTRAFRVASAEDRVAWDRVVVEVDRRLPSDLRDLVLAHAAARRGLLLVAHERAESHVAGHPGPVGEETRDWIRRLLSWAPATPRSGGG